MTMELIKASLQAGPLMCMPSAVVFHHRRSGRTTAPLVFLLLFKRFPVYWVARVEMVEQICS